MIRNSLNVFLTTLTVSYPLLVWFALDYLQPRGLALILALLFLVHFLFRRSPLSDLRANLLIVSACILFLLLIAWINQNDLLLVYPVFVSLLFLLVFAASLIYPPTVVERLARLDDPELPPKGVVYTRKVTQVWCGFFLGNASISLATVWYGDLWLWSLYNGCLSYVLMGLLMLCEMAVRRKVKESY